MLETTTILSKHIVLSLQYGIFDEDWTVAHYDRLPTAKALLIEQKTLHRERSQGKLSDEMGVKNTESKVYHCIKCNKYFGSRGGFYYHRRVHERGNIFKCEFCNQSFSRGWLLTKHQTKHHPKNIP